MTLFQAEIRKGNLYPIYNGVSRIVDECKLNIRNDGISIDETDLADLCRVSAKLPRELFEPDSYKCMKKQTIGINLTKYHKIIDKELDDNKIFEFKLIEPEGYTNPQLITIINHTEYKHTTLDPVTIRKTTENRIELKNTLKLKVPFVFMIEGIEAVEKYQDDEVLIGVDFRDNSTLFIRSNGDGTDGSNVKTKIDLPSPDNDEIIQSIYSMDYMKEIVKGLSTFKTDGNIQLKLNKDWPIEISVKSEFNNEYTLKYLLAPKINE